MRAGGPTARAGDAFSGKAGEIAERRVAIDGLWMFDRHFVSPRSTGRLPVVPVHGLGLSGRYMLPTAERLAPYFPVYLPDLPGFGDSSPMRSQPGSERSG
jgi:pimeloyl-ACP methyl ester carboxylesterase